MKKILSYLLPLSITLSLVSGVAVNSAPAASSNENITKYKELRTKDKSYFEGIIKKYTDMGNHWGLVSVATLSDINIIDGYPDGSFKPDNSISRAEYTKLLLTALMKEPVSGNSFVDTSNHWAKDILNTAVSSGIIVKAEYGDSFSPDTKIARVEMAKMVVRAIGLGNEADRLGGQVTTFADDAAFIPTDKGYIKVASEKGIISGYLDGTFRPNGQATRAEASQMIINMLEYFPTREASTSPTPTVTSAPVIIHTPTSPHILVPTPTVTPKPTAVPTYVNESPLAPKRKSLLPAEERYFDYVAGTKEEDAKNFPQVWELANSFNGVISIVSSDWDRENVINVVLNDFKPYAGYYYRHGAIGLEFTRMNNEIVKIRVNASRYTERSLAFLKKGLEIAYPDNQALRDYIYNDIVTLRDTQVSKRVEYDDNYWVMSLGLRDSIKGTWGEEAFGVIYEVMNSKYEKFWR